jgi:hypothetical protein
MQARSKGPSQSLLCACHNCTPLTSASCGIKAAAVHLSPSSDPPCPSTHTVARGAGVGGARVAAPAAPTTGATEVPLAPAAAALPLASPAADADAVDAGGGPLSADRSAEASREAGSTPTSNSERRASGVRPSRACRVQEVNKCERWRRRTRDHTRGGHQLGSFWTA